MLLKFNLALAAPRGRPIPRGACAGCTVRAQTICASRDDSEVAEVEAITSIIRLQAGDTLVREGYPRHRAYSLTEGMLRLSTLMSNGRRHITGFMMPGDYLGLADDQTYCQTAEAVTAVNICSFPTVHMDALMERFPELKDRLYAMTRKALRSARDDQVMLGQLAPVEKVASFLLAMARRAPGRSENVDTVRLPMSRSDIADYLGLTVETVSRSFTKLKVHNHIRLPEPHLVEIVDLRALKSVAGR